MTKAGSNLFKFDHCRLLLILSLCLSATSASAAGDKRAPAKQTGIVIQTDKHSFSQYQTEDQLGRTITFYVSDMVPNSEALPLVVYITGSGGDSVFSKDERGKIGGAEAYETLLAVIKRRARLLVVEKPGVQLFAEAKQPGTALGCSEEFLREHTLERWTEAINAAIEAGRTLPGIDQHKLLVVGHSEGGQVAPHVAASNSSVTHVADIAGGGPTQLFDMMISAQSDAERQNKAKPGSTTSTQATEEIIKIWKDIEADKDSYSKMWSGHTYRRWYSFCTNSPIEDLLKCPTKAYLVQGTADTSTPVVSFDVMQAILLSHNRPFVAERLEGANHGLQIKRGNEVLSDKRPEVMERIFNWFLTDK